MIHGSKYARFSIALLVAGSAISLIACGSPAKPSQTGDEKIISRTVRDMEVLSSDNGLKSRLMRAPLMEEHKFANPAFEEFREGMEVIGYDSLGVNPSSRVISDHALHWTARDVWQLSGNVVVEGEEGQKLYTQQLFWDVKTQKIWSNVDSKVEEGGDVLYGVGFEAMDDFSRWEFRGVDGTVGVDVEPVESVGPPAADSTATTSGSSLPADSLSAGTSEAPEAPDVPDAELPAPAADTLTALP